MTLGDAQEQGERASEELTKHLNANVPESSRQAVRIEAVRWVVEMKTVTVVALTEYLPTYSSE